MARAKRLPVPPRTDTSSLVEAWGAPIDGALLSLALVHRSYANEAGGIANNERLEFLGDSVLSVVIAERLFHDYPDVAESDLSRMRAATVSQAPLAAAARRIGLGDYVYLGKGESLHGGRDKDSILSDTFEALIGATYLTHGLQAALDLRYMGSVPDSSDTDYISPYTVADLTVSYAFGPHIVNLAINNLFDRYYEQSRDFRQPGINYNISYQYTF